uniref:RNA-directed DNA polymerase n=1 Tax=Strigamia maritima TaxID=126957 RepID=T1IQ84_STRMM
MEWPTFKVVNTLKSVTWVRKQLKRSKRLKKRKPVFTPAITPPVPRLTRIPRFIGLNKPSLTPQVPIIVPPLTLTPPLQPTQIPQPKRGRGRPRKVEIRTPIIPPITLVTTPKINISLELKRKRGRPPKNPKRLSGIPIPVGVPTTRQYTPSKPMLTPITIPMPIPVTTPLIIPDPDPPTTFIDEEILPFQESDYSSSSEDSQVSLYQPPVGPKIPIPTARLRTPRPGLSGLQPLKLTEAEKEAERTHDPPVEHPPFELLPSIDEIIVAQQEDDWSMEKITYITTQQLPNNPVEADRVKKQTENYQIHRGLLCRFLPVTTTNMIRCRQIYLPAPLRERYFRALHYPPSVGHLGVEKTLKKLQARVYWPKMKEDVQTWIQRWGFPKIIVSDNAPSFRSFTFKPNVNTINSAYLLSLKFSPYQLVVGQEARYPGDLDTDTDDGEPLPPSVAENLHLHMTQMREQAAENLRKSQIQHKSWFDLKRRAHDFQPGDWVTLKNCQLSSADRQFAAGLRHRTQGVYIIHKIVGPNTFILMDEQGQKTKPYHVTEIRRWYFEDDENLTTSDVTTIETHLKC